MIKHSFDRKRPESLFIQCLSIAGTNSPSFMTRYFHLLSILSLFMELHFYLLNRHWIVLLFII